MASRSTTALIDRRSVCATSAVWVMCFAPLVWIPAGANMWVFGKAAAVAAAVGLGVLAGRRGGLPRSVLALGAAGLLILALSTANHGLSPATFLGRAPRYEGILMLALYGGVLWLGSTLTTGSRARESLPDALSAASIALATLSVSGALGHNPLGDFVQERDGSLLGNATDQGLIGLLALASLAPLAWQRRDKLLALGAFSGALVIAISGSRAAMIGAVVALIVLAVLIGRRLGPLLWIAPISLAGLVALVPSTREHLTSQFSVGSRWDAWKMTWQLLLDHPFLGVGPGGYADAIGRYETSAWAHGAGSGGVLQNSPHSWPLQFAAVAGFPGLLLAAALVVVLLRALWRACRGPAADDLTPGLAAATIGFGCGLLVNFTIIGSTAPALFLLGVALASRDSHPLTTTTRRVALATTCVVLAAAACSSVAEIALARGVAQLRQGNVTEGLATMDLARTLRPADGDMLALTSFNVLGRGGATVQDEIAPRFAEESLALLPHNYRARLARGTLFVDAGAPAAGLEILDDMAEDFPARGLVHVHRARALVDLGRLDEARLALRAARRLGWKDPRIAQLKARIAAAG